MRLLIFTIVPVLIEGFFSPTVSYTHVLDDIRTGQLDKIVIKNDLKKTTLIEKSGNREVLYTDPSITTQLMKEAVQNKLEIQYENMFHVPDWVLPTILYTPFFVLGWTFFQKFSPDFRKYEFQTNVQNTTFRDWGGSKEVMKECKEMVWYFLNDHPMVKKPKGILLEGPPGTGKTMLARIIANHANASFLAFSASEFVELYAGMGALRVRNLFQHARKHSPCILFIDEIDAIGQKRKASTIGNEEREQTLNQLLSEMDGFQQNEDILVLAATNRKDILDPALLRPGRFDKIVHIPLPDRSSRREIIKIFLRNKQIETPIDWELLLAQTEGFSGADIEQWINEASIYSLRSNETILTQETLWNALERVRIGVKKDFDLRSDLVKKRIAVHEAGHTVVCLFYSDYFMFQKVSIQETYSGVGGYTMYNVVPDFAQSHTITKDLLMKQVQLLLGGRLAESIFYGDNHVSIGAHDDLNKANELCRQMVSQFGMGSKLNNVVISQEDFLSDQFASLKDYDTLALLRKAITETRQIIQNHQEFIDRLADELVFDVSLSENEVLKLWRTYKK